MFFFTIRRIVAAAVVLLVSSFLVFALCAGSFDPLAKYYNRNPRPAPSFFTHERQILGLNDNFFVRYLHWIGGAIHGNFGNDINGQPVSDQLWPRLLVTGRLVIAAVILAVILAVIVGIVGAVRQYKASDYVLTLVVYLLIALPTFWFAALLKQYVAGGVNNLVGHQVLYTLGEATPGLNLYGTTGEIWSDRIGHLVLPTISLALLSFAAWSRYQRSSMLDVLGSDYMRLARAKGLTYRRTVWRHGLRNALIPLTTIVALDVGTLIGGAVITETVFVWHGMGEYLFKNGIEQNDTNVVLGWLLVSAAFVILFNLIADLLYAVLDPRIRLA
jgi:peptide/nickel transport system permease protein